jgi:uncharacterized protein YydD (DUF2326 family)
MRLIRLLIKRGDQIVREITFKTGLNLILDKPTSQKTQTGNNVGKTTVLRLIDYCLGSDGADIWEDSEFKSSVNQEVYDFLHGPVPVSVDLTMEKPIARGPTTTTYTLNREFGKKAPGSKDRPTCFVNEKAFKKLEDYREAVKWLLFGTEGSKPTLRQLVPKFVRSSPIAMSRTLKFLSGYTTEATYEIVHLFLFGFLDVGVLEERPKLVELRKRLERDLQALTRIRKEGEIAQLLLHLQREIESITLSNQLRGEVPEIAEHANVVSNIRSEASVLAGELGALEGDIASLRLTIGELESEFADVDRAAVEAIYREAQTYIPKLHHDWNELTDFVQALRGRKRRFLESQVGDLQNRGSAVRERLRGLQSREAQEIGILEKSQAFNYALELRADLQEKLKQVGSLEQDLRDIHELKARAEDAERHLNATKTKIEDGTSLLQERVAIFNKYFSKLSEALYGEQYLLHFEETSRGAIAFELTAVGSNVGAGKKMSQTAAFDLAYVQFLTETGINFPKFVCHDGVESIHGNQLEALLRIANDVDGQLILSTLRDKLPETVEALVEECTVLQLAQDDRLFGL